MSDVVQSAVAHVTSGGTLDRAAARATMGAVLEGGMSPVRFGAIFGSLHARGETVEELAGFVDAMRAHGVTVHAPEGAIDTCGTGGDGADTVNISTAAAFVAAGAGAVVAKHGNRAVSSACGSADVLEALGGALATEPAAIEALLRDVGFGFMFAPSFHPAMRHAAAPRRELGVRTAFNLIGPLSNPAAVTRQVVGVPNAALATTLTDVFELVGCEHVLVVHGLDGLDEVSVGGPTVVNELQGGVRRTYVVHPADLGLSTAPLSELRGGDASCNARMLRAALAGEPGAVRSAIVANAAAALVVAGRASDLREGALESSRSIDSGAATDVLDRWVSASRSIVGEPT